MSEKKVLEDVSHLNKKELEKHIYTNYTVTQMSKICVKVTPTSVLICEDVNPQLL